MLVIELSLRNLVHTVYSHADKFRQALIIPLLFEAIFANMMRKETIIRHNAQPVLYPAMQQKITIDV